MIITLFQAQPEDNGYFVYLLPGEDKDPYALRPLVDYERKNSRTLDQLARSTGNVERPKAINSENKFYTLSKKGFVTYVDDRPIESISLAEWLIDRNYFRQISNKTFFKNFRRWKHMRMWRRNILHKKRDEVTQVLA